MSHPRRQRDGERASTQSVKKMTQEQIRLGRLLYPVIEHNKPSTFAECMGIDGPCPFVSCKHNLFIDVSDIGTIKYNFPDLELWELPETCALKVAARGGVTLEEVGEFMNLTRERIRQLELAALKKAKQALAADGFRSMSDFQFAAGF